MKAILRDGAYIETYNLSLPLPPRTRVSLYMYLTQQLRTLIFLTEDMGFLPSNHTVIHNHL